MCGSPSSSSGSSGSCCCWRLRSCSRLCCSRFCCSGSTRCITRSTLGISEMRCVMGLMGSMAQLGVLLLRIHRGELALGEDASPLADLGDGDLPPDVDGR